MVLALAVAAAAWAPADDASAQLKPRTLAEFQRYVQLTEMQMQEDGAGQPGRRGLWVDARPAEERQNLYTRLRQGDIVVVRGHTRDRGRDIDVDNGMIHHWIGTIWLPGVSLDQAVAFAQDYDRYREFYKPTIQRSRLLERDGNRFTIEMRLVTKHLITIVLDARYVVDYRQPDPSQVLTRSRSVSIDEVKDAGSPDERLVPSERGSGYLWRINNYCTFDEQEGGTMEQCESVSLTRDIPLLLSWIVKPFVTKVPRESLEFSLGRTRDYLLKAAGRPGL